MMARRLAVLTISAMLLFAPAVDAVSIDGQLGVDYGVALVTQTTQTGLSHGQIVGDNNLGDLNFANGSELDQGYAFVSDGVLYLFLAGNQAMKLNANENGTVGDVLDIFVDSVPDGQNMLNGLGAGVPINGLTFDVGFAADYWLELSGGLSGGTGSPPTWSAGYAALLSPGGGTFVNLGSGPAGGPGTLSGGSNPHGILATIDNHNIAGVTFGCNAASGAGVTTGVEWAIPLAAIGNPTECIQLTVIIRESGTTSPVSNQVLGPVPPGTCPLGPASMVNFANITGDQFFTVCPPPTDVPPSTAVRFALFGAKPNPSRGDRVLVAFALPDSRPAALQIIDCGGRIVREKTVGASGGGFGAAELSEGRRLAPGIYWLRLSQGRSSVARKLCVVN